MLRGKHHCRLKCWSSFSFSKVNSLFSHVLQSSTVSVLNRVENERYIINMFNTPLNKKIHYSTKIRFGIISVWCNGCHLSEMTGLHIFRPVIWSQSFSVLAPWRNSTFREVDQMGQLEEVRLQEWFAECHNHREHVSISESTWLRSLTKTVSRLEQLARSWMQQLKGSTCRR